MTTRIDIPTKKIAAFCRRNGIKRLALFGSVLRDDFTSESDVDVLVEFEPDRTPGLAFFTMEQNLSEILGRHADMHTYKSIKRNPNRLFRNEILNSAEVQYERT